MREYVREKDYPLTFISDASNALYRKYHVDRSIAKVMRSLFNGFVQKAKHGYQLYTKRFRQDGHMSTIPASFLINESGVLEKVYYGNFVGDYFDIASYTSKQPIAV